MKLMNVRRRTCLTTALVVGVALTSANLANARNIQHNDNNNKNTAAKPHFVINGQSANDKKIIRDRKKEKQAENKKEKQAEKKKKECEKIIVPTAECGVSRKDPVGNTHPTLPPTKTTDGTGTKGPSPVAATATITNGKTTSAIANGKGLTVTATSSGTITVSSTDHSSVTMAGDNVTLRGATTVQAGPGLAVHRLPNGDILVTNVPKGVTAADTVKDIGKAAGNFGNTVAASPIVGGAAATVLLGSAVQGVATGHPIDTIKKAYKDIEQDAGRVIEWVSGWF
jgi:hypothetical protein